MVITRNIKLLPQRKEILRLLCEGKTLKEIAAELSMDWETVRKNIIDMKKINECVNITQLIYKWARFTGSENKTLH